MTMTRDKIEELKRLAEALGGIEFKAELGETSFFIWDSEGKSVCRTIRIGKWDAPRTVADFIAAANPQIILSLLALAERALEPQGQASDMQAFAQWKGYPLPPLNADGKFDSDALHREWRAFCAGRSSQPQGQALPELPKPDFTMVAAWVESGNTPSTYRKDLVLLNDIPVFKEETVRAYASQLALPAGPVPDGWQMVPKKLTPEMAEAIKQSIANAPHTDGVLFNFQDDWDAALAAAPQHPAVSPAVAQPVADERAVLTESEIMDIARECEDEYCFPINHKQFARKLLARAALCQPAEEARPSDCSRDPNCCPQNEGHGCQCSALPAKDMIDAAPANKDV